MSAWAPTLATLRSRSTLARQMLGWAAGLLLLLVALQLVGAYLRARGMPVGFGFMGYPAGFDMSESVIRYSGDDSYARALLAGGLNTLKVSGLGIVLASIIGLLVALCRLASNPLLSGLARGWVEATRNIPLLLHLFAWYAAITFGLPDNRSALQPLPGVVLSNRGIWLPSLDVTGSGWLLIAAAALTALLVWLGFTAWQRRGQGRAARFWGLKLPVAVTGGAAGAFLLSSVMGYSVSISTAHLDGFSMSGGASFSAEFAALLIGLTVYTSGSLAEVFRGAIIAVPKAQTEAAISVGLGPVSRLRLVILPQALRIGLPPTINQYLNLLKNSSLAVAVGYPDIVSVGNTAINQTGQAISIILVFMAVYVSLGFLVSALMHTLTRRPGHVA